MEKMIEKTEQEMRDEEARELEINYLLGLLARYDDRHEYLD